MAKKEQEKETTMRFPEHRIPNKLLKVFAQRAKTPEERREYTDAIHYGGRHKQVVKSKGKQNVVR